MHSEPSAGMGRDDGRPHPLVSVVVPVFNTAAYLEECIDSVRSQSFSRLELVLVDDGSTDGSSAICDSHGAADSRVRVIHQRNAGVSAAMNRGLRASTGEMVAFLGSDDVLGVDHLRHLVAASLATGADIAISGFTRDELQWDRQAHHHRDPARLRVFTPDELIRVRHPLSPITTPSPCAKVWRRSLLSDAPFPEGRVHEDAMVTHRLLRGASRVVITGEVDYFYRVRDSGITGSRPTMTYLVDKARAHQMRVEDLADLGDAQLLHVEFSKSLNYTLLALGAARAGMDDQLLHEARSLRTWLLTEGHAYVTSRRSRMALTGLRLAPRTAGRLYALTRSRD